MTNRWVEFAELSGDDALEIVQQAATAHPAAAGEVEKFRARVESSRYLPLNVTLIVPDLTGTHTRPLLETLRAAYAKRKGGDSRISFNNDNTVPFCEAAIRTVLESASNDAVRRSEPMAHEFLLLDREPLEEGRVARLIAEISLHSTAARWAQISTQGAKHLVFHVLSDTRRRPTFESALQSQTFRGVSTLYGYEVKGRRVFLPPSAKPSATGLGFFHWMLTQHPGLLGTEIPRDDAEILAAIDAHVVAGQPTFQCLPLQAVQFTDLRGDDSRITQGFHVEFGKVMPAPEAREQVRQWLDRHSETHGYRLRLRPTRYRHAQQRDIDLLLERQMQIDDQLALLQNLLPPRPQLYRFSQAQLPLLAQALRSYAIEDLEKDRITYVCQGNGASNGAADPQLWHFLLIDPHAARKTEPFIPKLAPEADKSQTAFWLDPFWSRYYPTSQGNVLLYVPEGQALLPTPHSWNGAEMDRYLREDVLGRWFHGRHGVQPIPPRPLYVFDRGRTNPDTIEIAILDQQKFEPVRQKLGWINSNLLLLDAYPQLEEMVRRFADQELAHQHEVQLTKRRAVAQEQFQLAAQTVAKEFVEQTRDLTLSLETALGHLHEHTKGTVAQLTALQAELEKLIALQKSEAKLETEARTAASESEAAARDAVQTFGTTEKQAQKTLDDFAKRRADMKARVEDAIRAQRQAIDQLGRTLRSRWF